jgi:hypothetical protein
MRKIASPKFLSILVLSLATLLPSGLAQTQAGACGSQPFCVETNDFVATITSFRSSLTTSNVKIIDTSIRFQNKTNQQLILGYAISSGIATDDQGNRLVVGGPNGFRGIGYVNGSNLDPKFVVRPGGYADAQFELLAQGWPKIVGFTHQLDLTVNEINSFQGNQHTVGGEFPLHFQGLANGSAAASPAVGALTNAAAGSGPCGLAGAQGAAGQASAGVSTAANTLSSLGSLFGKKKTAQKANQVAGAAAGCDPRVNNVASVAGGLAGAAAAANAQQAQANAATAQAQQMMAGAGGNAATAQAQQMMAAAGGNPTTQQAASNANLQATMQAAAAQSQADAQANAQVAAAATAANPGNLAASAFSKFKLSQLKKQQKMQQSAQQPQQQQASPQQVASVEAPTGAALSDPQQSSSQQNMTGANMQGAQLQDQANPDLMHNAATKAASAAKYDILGIHLGMSAKEAAAILHSRGMQLAPDTIKYDFLPGPLTYGVEARNAVELRTNGSQPGGEKVYLMLSMPPNQQTVSKISRLIMFTKETAPTAAGLVADLVKKYGTPSYDSNPADLYYTGYRILFWVDDAQGRRLLNELNPDGHGYSVRISNCLATPSFKTVAVSMPGDVGIEPDTTTEKIRLEKGYAESITGRPECADLTMVSAKILYGYPIGVTARDVAGGLVVGIGSGPMDRVETDATHNFLVQAATQRDARQKQAAQKNKPAL